MRKAFTLIAVLIWAGLSFKCSKNNDTTVSISIPATDSTNLYTSNWFVTTTVEGGLSMLMVLKDTTIEFSTPATKIGVYEVDPFDSLGRSSAKVVKGNKVFLSDEGSVEISSLSDGKVSGIFSFNARDFVSNEKMNTYGTFSNLTIKDDVDVIVRIATMDTISFDRAVFGYEVFSKDSKLSVSEKGICISLNTNFNLSIRECKNLVKSGKIYAQFCGLSPTTRYFVRPFAKVGDKVIWGRVSSFVTQKKKPEPPPFFMRPRFEAP